MSIHIVVIGAGPGGYTAAFEAAKKGAQVTLVESTWIGGTCLNCGCIPTKTFKSSAEALHMIKRSEEFGLLGNHNITPSMQAIVARKNKVRATLRGGLEKTCAKLKINLVYGKATLIDNHTVKITKQELSPEGLTPFVEEISCDKIIIATGSSNLNLPSLPIDHTHILNSDDVLDLDHIPATIIIVGGGVVGCELAFIFQSFGSKVTIVEGLTRVLPLPSIDEEMSKLMQREMKKTGITVKTCQTVSAVEVKAVNVETVNLNESEANDNTQQVNKVFATIGASPFLESVPESAKKESVLEADVLIVAVGRSPNTQELALENAGIETDKRGYILVNEYLETSVPDVYAIGDILGPQKIMLAHVASTEALVAVENCFGAQEKMDYSVVPSCIFSSPEIAVVGLSEAQAKEQGYDIKCSLFQFRELGKAQAMGELAGVFKLIADKKTDILLGAHLAGAHSSDMIAELALALKMGATIKDIAKTIHAHPTLAEGVLEAAHQILHD